MTEHLQLPKPSWRGRLHQVAFYVSMPAGVSLVALAETTVARVAAIVYALSLSSMYAVSAAFHRIGWRPRVWQWMRRLDHSMIFVLIAGTYTPFSLLVLDGTWSIVILSVVWAGAIAGVALKLATSRLRSLGSTMYLVLGWVAVVTLPVSAARLGPAGLALLISGGLLYTVGSVVLLRRRPDPNPAVFGYHEVWHTMVVAASLCHYALILMMVRG